MHINLSHSYLLAHYLCHHLPPHCLGIAFPSDQQAKYHHVHSPNSHTAICLNSEMRPLFQDIFFSLCSLFKTSKN
ncbi:hypothetical protein Fmac_030972 [Flemingia macrophylla]|uniref:Uncharacterized protein n=1 Tax=Flemingia macrophylla TaxID=520843 RepID=A0ABD1L0T1_9FABA